MIRMTYDQVMNDNFTNAFRKLANAPLNIQVAYQVKKIADDLQKQKKKVQNDFTAVVKKIMPQDGATTGEAPPADIQAKIAEAQEEFGKNTFTVDRPQIDVHSITNVQFSALDLTMLEPVLFDSTEGATVSVPSGKVTKAAKKKTKK